jgi:alpha-aminoadipate carrier protein LysW
MPYCPACDEWLEVRPGDYEKGEIFDCPECGSELEVVNTSPLEIDFAESEEEYELEQLDWD